MVAIVVAVACCWRYCRQVSLACRARDEVADAGYTANMEFSTVKQKRQHSFYLWNVAKERPPRHIGVRAFVF